MSEIVSWRDIRGGDSSDGVVRVDAWVLVLLVAVDCSVPRRAVVGGAPVSRDAIALDQETVIGSRHYARGYPAQNRDGSVNAVIEIPSGTTAKFEVGERDGVMRWRHDRDHGGRRELDYLAFVGNYGMVPRTLADDGDALDIIVLGRGIERGHVAHTRVIGVLKMAADGARDDKLIAVPLEPALQNGFSRLHELVELDEHYRGAREILWTWFSNYWGPGATTPIGWGDAAEALAILEASKRAVMTWSRQPAASDPRPRARRPFHVLAHGPSRHARP
ncbi:MAG: inorganic diphosphatase [Kofleriaceae bacterium]